MGFKNTQTPFARYLNPHLSPATSPCVTRKAASARTEPDFFVKKRSSDFFIKKWSSDFGVTCLLYKLTRCVTGSEVKNNAASDFLITLHWQAFLCTLGKQKQWGSKYSASNSDSHIHQWEVPLTTHCCTDGHRKQQCCVNNHHMLCDSLLFSHQPWQKSSLLQCCLIHKYIPSIKQNNSLSLLTTIVQHNTNPSTLSSKRRLSVLSTEKQKGGVGDISSLNIFFLQTFKLLWPIFCPRCHMMCLAKYLPFAYRACMTLNSHYISFSCGTNLKNVSALLVFILGRKSHKSFGRKSVLCKFCTPTLSSLASASLLLFSV